MRRGTSGASRHDELLRRWPRLWGEDRDLGAPGELSRALSRAELAHLHGVAPPGRRRPIPRTVEAAVEAGRPFLAVGGERGGRRAYVLAALPGEAADVLVADEEILVPALRRAGEGALRVLRAATEAVLTVIEVPTGRHRATRPLLERTLDRLREDAGAESDVQGSARDHALTGLPPHVQRGG